jgi:tripartite-type tricarboxylate transporter receptor subunit TctC
MIDVEDGYTPTPVISHAILTYNKGQGIGAPRDTPTEIIEKLSKEINAGLADPNFKARIANLGAETFASSPAEFGKFIVEYTEKSAKVIRAANIKVE